MRQHDATAPAHGVVVPISYRQLIAELTKEEGLFLPAVHQQPVVTALPPQFASVLHRHRRRNVAEPGLRLHVRLELACAFM